MKAAGPNIDVPLTNPEVVATGIPGLDYILRGGLPANHLYLVEGDPGTGKTTLALQYLLAGQARGAKGLYVTLSETKAELWKVAVSHGWSLDGIGLFELGSLEERLHAEAAVHRVSPLRSGVARNHQAYLRT